MSMNARSYDMESREITKRKLYDIAEGMEKITDCKLDVDEHPVPASRFYVYRAESM